MTDLATLGLVIDSTQVEPAVARLDNLTAAGAKAEVAVDRLGDSAAQTSAQVKGASASAAEYAANVQRMATNTRLTGGHVDSLGSSTRAARSHMMNLGFQVQDLGVQLASGGNPLMALAQQGSQIVGVFQQAGDEAGKLAYQVGVVIGRFLPLAVAVGAAYAAFKLFQDRLNDQAPAQAAVAGLGLTEKEMKKLENTAVTAGDMFTGLWEVIKERSGVDESIASFTDWMILKFVEAVKGAGRAIAALYGETVGTYRAISMVWNDLPAMFGAAFARGVNAAAEKLEQFINKVIGGINSMARQMNALIGKDIFGQIGTVSLGRVEADFGKSFGNIRGIIRGEIASATAEAQGAIDGFVDDVAKAAIAARDARLRAQADEIIADRTGKAAKAHRDRADAADKEAEALRKLWEARKALFESPWEISKDLLNADTAPVEMGDVNFDQFAKVPDFAGQLLDQLTAIAEQSQVTADIMNSAFGSVGDVFGSLLTSVTDYSAAREAMAQAVLDGNMTQESADKRLATLSVKNTAAAISGVKSLFKEKSAAFKAISAIEKAYAIWQAAETIASIVRDTAKTTSAVANSAVRTTANTAEGGSKIFAELGPWAFPVVAAMVAVLAALGAKGGGGGGGGGYTPPTAEDLQEQAGTGTILGDSKAKSDSIARSLELVAANTNRDLEYSNAMLQALRNIDLSIAKMAGTVARQISVSGSLFDTSGQDLGTNSKKGFLGVFGGSTTTRSLYDLGVMFGASTVGSILEQGISGQSYQVIEKIKKKKGFLGIGGSTKTTYETTYGSIDSDITAAIQDVIGSLRDSLVAGADVIGLEGAEAVLNSFQVNLGKISFKGMTGAEIEDQLNAVFSSIGDQMAGKLLPSLASMQLVGEGLFETFMRVAKEYQAVDIAMKSLGRTFGAVGIESVAMRDHLVQLFGGLDEFLESTNTFRDEFLTEAEQMAPIAASVRAEMVRLGLAGITTRDQFKQAVLGLDLTTTAGREMYASLLAVAPAFDKVLDYVEKLNKAQIDSLQKTVDQFTKFAEGLRKYRETLFQTDATQGNAYNRLRSQFMSTADLAATGDATALGGLENAGRSFLEAARNNAGTREQYLRDVALVARGVDAGIIASEEVADYAQLQLDALENAVGILAQISTNTGALADAAKASIPVLPGVAPAPTTATPTAPPPTQDQTQTLIEQNATIIRLLTDQKQLWQRFEGDGLTVKTDADTPLSTVAV